MAPVGDRAAALEVAELNLGLLFDRMGEQHHYRTTAAARSGRYPHLGRALIPTTPPAEPRSTDPDAIFDRLVERVLAGLLRP